MSMKHLVYFFILVIGVFLGGCEKTEHYSLPPKYDFQPNIVWITCEDMSPRLGCYGDSIAKSPNIDNLAAQGVRYTNAFSVSGVCAPSRSALITGMYPTTIGSMHMRTMTRTSAIDKITDPDLLAIPTYEAVPSPDVKCFTEFLRARGYYCSNNSKEDYQFKRPVTAWDESSKRAHWRNRDVGQPFFAVFNFTITHESQIWIRAKDSLYTDPSKVVVPPYYPDTPIIRKDIARHYDNIALLDRQVDGLLDQLKEDGLMDSTIIFFFSDHGDGLPRAKRWIYDSGIKVPLIIRYPDLWGAGTINDNLISFIDFAPTVLSLADVEIPGHMQGRAFAGQQKAVDREYIFAAKDRMDPAMDNRRAVRDKHFKYIKNYMPERPYVQFLPYRDQMDLMKELIKYNKEGRLDEVQSLWFMQCKPSEELYDITVDPYEINNLAGHSDYKDVLIKLRNEHLIWKEETNDWGLIPETELIKKLWPPDGIQPVTEVPKIIMKQIGSGDSVSVRLTCSTEGASIGYKINEKDHWLLYSKPILLKRDIVLSVQSVRLGFKPSDIVVEKLN